MSEIKISPEIESMLVPLKEQEFKLLEESILEEGIRDAIVVWRKGDELILVDGHNRYKIAQKYNLPFEIKEKQFDNLDEALIWVINNQLGRRNIPEWIRWELVQKEKEILLEIGREKQVQTLGGYKYNSSVLTTVVKTDEPHNTRREIANKLKWSEGKVSKAEVVYKKAPEEIKEKLRKEDMTINQAYQNIKRQEKLQAVEQKLKQKSIKANNKIVDIYTTEKQYNIIYADPAWKYWDGGNKNQSLHYHSMDINDICALPIKRIADENCILFIWVTYPILPDSFKVIESWGFKYSTCGFVWVKKNKNDINTNFIGCGNWTRANSELCLIATKGQISRLDAGISQIIESPVEEHSKKPDIVRELIVKLVGALPRIELFARQAPDGWDVWGDEI